MKTQHLRAILLGATMALSGVYTAAPPAAGAQTQLAQVHGNVTDASGAAIPNAKVNVKSDTMGLQRNVTTNAAGEYLVTEIPAGTYTVTISAPGFGDYTGKVQLTVGGNTPFDAKMAVQSQTSTVQVAAEDAGAQVDTTNQEVSTVITPKQVLDLPSLTRNPYDFVSLSGNVTSDPGGSTGANGLGVSFSGQRSASTEILLDGVENVDLFSQTVGQQIPLDAVQEYRVITSGFSAEYGRAAGGIVNLVTKSGTNHFHGSLYDYNRISALAANTYYEDATNFYNRANGAAPLPPDHFTRNMFGYSVGGPLWPALKDKLFFFSNTEWNRIRSSGTQPYLVPTSAFLATTAPNTQAYFAQFGKLAPNLQLGPLVPVAGMTGPAPFQQVNVQAPIDAGAGAPVNAWDTLDRVDYNPTDRTTMFFRYGGYHAGFFPGYVSLSPYAGYDTSESDFDQSIAASVNHVFTPNVVTTTQFSYARLTQSQPLGTAPVSPTLYLDQSNTASVDNATGISIAMPGYLPTSPGGAIPFGGPQNLYQLASDLNWTVKNHTFHFGGTYLQVRDNRAFGAYENAIEQIAKPSLGEAGALGQMKAGQVYQFAAAVNPNGRYPCSLSPTTGSLVQTPACTLNLPVGPPSFVRENTFNDGAVYAADTWRVTPRFTANLGLRWEYYGVQHNANPNIESNFYPSNNSNPFLAIREGQVLTTPNSPTHGIINQRFNNFAPRLGFAYDPLGNGKWSIRGGYGISYERDFGNVTYNVIQNPPYYAVVNIYSNQGGFGQLPLTSSNAGPLAGTGSAALPPTSLRAPDPHMKTAYAHQYDFSIQHELADNSLLSVEYVGTRGVHQYAIANDNRAYFGGIFMGDSILSLPLNYQYSSINVREANGDSYYNSVNVGYVNNNFGRYGLQLQANYTFAHSMDDLSSTFSQSNNNFNLGYINPFNPGYDLGNSDYDVRHRIVLGGIYQPKYLEFNSSHLLHSTIGGLEFAPIFSARTGTPFSIYDCSQIYGYACPRISAAHDVHYKSPKAVDTAGIDKFNLQTVPVDAHNSYYSQLISADQGAALATGPGGTFGGYGSEYPTCTAAGCNQNVGMGRNQFYSPAVWNWDMGVYKNFNIKETYTIQLRGEFYDILNHHNMYPVLGNADFASLVPTTQVPSYNQPGATVAVPTGQPGNVQGVKGSPAGIPSASDERRDVQLALRFQF